jgi:DNA-binding response OmpR family regulator
MRVLVIEDSAALRVSLETALRSAGYAVDAAADGTTGLWRAESETYDVILLDLLLPGVAGLEVLRRLRARGERARVLAITALDGVDDRVRGLDLGADDYLTKPFAVQELLARVRSLCRRAYDVVHNELRVGDLELDMRARTAQVGGTRIDLTRGEYMLLELLALRAGHVLSRSEIERHLYDEHYEPTSNVVDAAVARLRRRLERAGSGVGVRTRRGLGYQLDAGAG